MMVSTERLAGLIASDFYGCQLDLSLRRSPPAGATWDSMPEVEAVRQLRAQGASDNAVRVFLTFIAAMDRARDATTLWHAGVVLFGSHPEVFDTHRAAGLPLSRVRHLLANSGVSQRHGPDARAWHRIAESLATGTASPVHRVIDRGAGDAQDLLKDVKTKDHAGPRFPMLRGPKIGPMWVRMLAEPGGAAITRIDTIPVAVDVHVRRVTENLRATDTRGLRLTEAKPRIQSAWKKAVVPALIPGPSRIAGTCAALDPALWAFGKYGCSHCETVGVRVPIGRACDYCQLRSPVVRAERRDGPVGLPPLRRRGRGRGMSSQVDPFWRTVVAREDFRSALRTAADGSESRIAVPGLSAPQNGCRESWQGVVYVRHPDSLRGGGMSHARSLGRMAIASGVLATWPSTEFCFTIDKAGQWLTVRSETP